MTSSSKRQNTRPFFSITVVNWNGGDHIRRCIESVLRQPPELFDLTVVDNGSTDGSQKYVTKTVEEVRKKDLPHRTGLITFAANQGFGKAHNTAFGQGTGEFVLVLNSDAVLSPGFLETAAGAIRRHPEAAMFATRIFRDAEKKTFDNVGLIFCADGQNRGLAHGEPDQGQYDAPMEVFCPSGAAGIYRRSTIEKTGFFDEDYFAYGEDFELGFRLRRAGENCILIPDAEVVHEGAASLGEASPRRLHLIERNRIWTVIKHFPFRRVLQAPGVSIERYMAHWQQAQQGKGVAGSFMQQHGALELFLTTARADLDALQGAPRMLWKRATLARHYPMTDSEFAGWLEEFGTTPEELAKGV